MIEIVRDGKKFEIVPDGFTGYSDTPSFSQYDLTLRVIPWSSQYEEEAKEVAKELGEKLGGRVIGNHVIVDLRDKETLIYSIVEGIGRWLVKNV